LDGHITKRSKKKLLGKIKKAIFEQYFKNGSFLFIGVF
jgi:hypothetical protein